MNTRGWLLHAAMAGFGQWAGRSVARSSTTLDGVVFIKGLSCVELNVHYSNSSAAVCVNLVLTAVFMPCGLSFNGVGWGRKAVLVLYFGFVRQCAQRF